VYAGRDADTVANDGGNCHTDDRTDCHSVSQPVDSTDGYINCERGRLGLAERVTDGERDSECSRDAYAYRRLHSGGPGPQEPRAPDAEHRQPSFLALVRWRRQDAVPE